MEKLDWDEMFAQKLLEDWHNCLTNFRKNGEY